ncbi:ABC transporter permease [Pseudonocardiaceae bacterium YIM PH 21723]|nr:ABC transporter permease [Pseudonocardiaceae bacterium YIM PH 21723]
MRWALADSWTITRRDLLRRGRQPGMLLIELAFPIMMVLMFGFLLGGAITVPGGGNYLDFLLPGMFAMTMFFGAEATMAAVTGDKTKGVTDRFRSMPMAPSAVVAGRSGADLINSVAGLVVMIGTGLLVGWRWHNGSWPALAAVGLLLLLRFALIWLGIYLGLLAEAPESIMALQILVWPVGFLSTVFVAPATMPGWLGTIASWNPLSATVTACRELFGNPVADASWPGRHSLLLAVLWPIALNVLFGVLSVRRYQRLSR